jgi:hypothetical protein
VLDPKGIGQQELASLDEHQRRYGDPPVYFEASAA